MFDHQLISKGSIQITARNGTRFHIVASGQNEEGQLFTISAAAEFQGVHVYGSESDTDESIRTRLRQWLDDADLSGTRFKLGHNYDSGVRMGQSFFSPKTE